MEFEEMQTIWCSPENDLHDGLDIDETVIIEKIKRRSQSVERKLAWVERIMIGVNLVVGIILLGEAFWGSDQRLRFIFPAAYLAYAVYAVIRRGSRRREEVDFPPTLVGELDKAIWRTDYLIRQARSMITWYLLPLALMFTVFAIVNDKLAWAAGLLLILLPVTYFGARWEVKRFYRPKKRALESLREELTSVGTE